MLFVEDKLFFLLLFIKTKDYAIEIKSELEKYEGNNPSS
jgi:hypothetical protein